MRSMYIQSQGLRLAIEALVESKIDEMNEAFEEGVAEIADQFQVEIENVLRYYDAFLWVQDPTESPISVWLNREVWEAGKPECFGWSDAKGLIHKGCVPIGLITGSGKLLFDDVAQFELSDEQWQHLLLVVGYAAEVWGDLQTPSTEILAGRRLRKYTGAQQYSLL